MFRPYLLIWLFVMAGMATTVFASEVGAYGANVFFVNYTESMFLSINTDIWFHIPLNDHQLAFLAFLQALSNQPGNKPSIVSVNITSTGVRPLGAYSSYETYLINATLSDAATTLLFYPVTVYWAPDIPPETAYLVALPGTKYAIMYTTIIESSTICKDQLVFSVTTPMFVSDTILAEVWYTTCTNSIAYTPINVTININGVNYMLVFNPYNGTSMTYPQPPVTYVFNVTAQAGSIVAYNLPLTTPLTNCFFNPSITLSHSCESSGFFKLPPGYELIKYPMYMSPIVYNSMPLIVTYPTRPGLYLLLNPYTIPPSDAAPISSYVIIYANVTGPSVVFRELFSVSVPYGTRGLMTIHPSPLQLNGTASGGYLARIIGGIYTRGASALFYGWVAGYNTDSPRFVSVVLYVYDTRGFWALTPTTLKVMLFDDYSNLIGYGLVTLEPNYWAWAVIIVSLITAMVIVVVVYCRWRCRKWERGGVIKI